MPLDFTHLIPHSATGFGPRHKVFASGRLGATLNDFGGLYEIYFWGTQPDDATPVLFKGDSASSYTRLFRVQLVIAGEPWHLEFSDTEILANGYVSHFAVAEKGVKVRHRLTLVREALVFSLEVLENTQGLPLRQRFEHHTYTQNGDSAIRSFSPWRHDLASGWSLEISDRLSDARWTQMRDEMKIRPKEGWPIFDPGFREGRTHVGFIGDLGLDFHGSRAGRTYFTGGEFTMGSHACALVFATTREGLETEAAWFLPGIAPRAIEADAALRRRMETRPEVHSGNTVFDSLAANIPPLVESLEVRDVPGGLRASATHYWIWGWDTMMASDAMLLAGDRDFVRDALRFYRDTAHPEAGVGHMFTRTLRVRLAQAPAAQCLYAIMLYQFYAHTGDAEAAKEFYPLARTVFETTLGTVNEKGFGKGIALFPDYPQHAGQTGDDLSVFNNSLLYQAARCIETLALLFDDAATAAKASELARRMEQNFTATFWDEEKKYLYDSVDSVTGKPRPSYPGHALLWQSPFAQDLIVDKLADCGRFQAKHHQTGRGFLVYPRWDPAYDGDGNQLNQIWTTHDAFITAGLAAAGLQDSLARWIDNCAWFWEQLTVIEGYTSSTCNDSGTPDAPGGTQAFGAKSIYMAFLSNCAGLQIDAGGVTLQEGIARPIEIAKLPFRGSTIHLKIEGAGRFLESLNVKGTAVVGSRKIPANLLKGDVKIAARRTEAAPAHPVILSLHGATVHSVEIANGKLHAKVSGLGSTWLRFHGHGPSHVVLDGKTIDVSASDAIGIHSALLPLAKNTPTSLEIVHA